MAASAKAITAIGRRKNSSARVSLKPAGDVEAGIVINKRAFAEYFPRDTVRSVVMQPLELTERSDRYHFEVNVQGGGLSGQAGAILLGIARALEKAEPELRPTLKKAGLLTRDARAVERKKPGRHKARRKPQFSKR